jgi:hypothetical protein
MMHLVKPLNKPSPLEGEGRVRGALLEESPSSHPSPSREEGESRKIGFYLVAFPKRIVPKTLIYGM